MQLLVSRTHHINQLHVPKFLFDTSTKLLQLLFLFLSFFLLGYTFLSDMTGQSFRPAGTVYTKLNQNGSARMTNEDTEANSGEQC